MPFQPPRCPNPVCEQHQKPTPGFFRRRGFYRPQCRRDAVPRFRCLTCRVGFSRQTFRYDYRDRRPQDNVTLFWLLIGGMSLRQCGRMLDMNVRAVQQKLRKMAAMAAGLHTNLSPRLPADRHWLLDEEETYEAASIRPLTMPVLIEKEAWFVVATSVGPIRRLSPPGTARRVRQEHEEATHGLRPDRSRECVQQVLQTLASRVPSGRVFLNTDQKASYATIAREVFGDRVVHETTAGTRIRHTHNPLFAINTTLAMTRDNCGRLRRRSWLVTKKAECLQGHLNVFVVYRNYVRRRFNHDPEATTPAKVLGLLPRNLRVEEVLGWRQDWGKKSIHPTSIDAARTTGDTMTA